MTPRKTKQDLRLPRGAVAYSAVQQEEEDVCWPDSPANQRLGQSHQWETFIHWAPNLLQWETSIHWAPNLLQWTLWFYRPFPVAPPPYFPIKANSPCLFTGFAYNPPFLYSRNGNSSGCSQVNLLLSLKKNWLLTQLKLRHIKIDCIPATGGPNTDFPKWMWPHCIHRAHIIRLRLLGTYFGKYFISPSTILII